MTESSQGENQMWQLWKEPAALKYRVREETQGIKKSCRILDVDAPFRQEVSKFD